MAPTAKPKTWKGKGNVTPPNAHAAAAPGRVRRTQTPARTGKAPNHEFIAGVKPDNNAHIHPEHVKGTGKIPANRERS